jgi:hypothetical protein
MSRSLPPNLLVAGRVQRLLSPLPLETQRTILEFTLKCLEEEASKPVPPAQAAE